MNKMLAIALLTACVVNLACLYGHLGTLAEPATNAAGPSPMRIASSLGSLH